MPSVTLTKDYQGKHRKGNWNYRLVIGMLNFVAQSMHPEIACSVHQCPRFCEEPKLSYEVVVQKIVKRIISTQNTKSELNRSLIGP